MFSATNGPPDRVPCRAVRRVPALIACCALLAGCGGGERQDADEPSGSFELEVVDASFPASQSIGQSAKLTISVRNAGKETAPNVAVSLDGLYRRSEQEGVADPWRPVFIVDRGPAEGATAYVGTWSLGALAPGATKEFTWRLTAVVPGTHTLSYTAEAGLDGRARAHARSGGPPTGKVTARVSDAPTEATVDPETGAVERH